MGKIILIGMPGCGKSSLGKRAAKDLGLEFIDTDQLIEDSERRSIADIFRDSGEQYFRDLETRTLKLIARESGGKKQSAVISLGGGMVERDENVKIIRALGLVVFIDRAPDSILGNITFGARRPLLSDPEKLHEIYERRIELYRAAAHKVLKNDGNYKHALKQLVSLICIRGIAGRFALIGDPVIQSLSPELHTAAFEKIGVKDSYHAIHVVPQALKKAMSEFKSGEAAGLNVTIPHKISIVELLDELRGDASICGAVNTVVREKDKLIGYNTDMEGLRQALLRHGADYRGSSVAIFGAGGAAAGVLHKAASEGARRITLICRSPVNGAAIAASMTSAPEIIAWDFSARDVGDVNREEFPGADEASATFDGKAGELSKLASALRDTDIFVNATPCGMTGGGGDFAGFEFLKLLPKHAFVCDLVYKPAKTGLLSAAAKLGLTGGGGLDMLIWQAILADELFLGEEIDRDALFEYLRKCMLEYMHRRDKEL
jgi:shikimate dehydrogenase